MSVWDKIVRQLSGRDKSVTDGIVTDSVAAFRTGRYAFIDTEVGLKDKKIHDIGSIRFDGAVFHGASKQELYSFLSEVDYLCGHNIINHDVKYLFKDGECKWPLLDTLYISPILFPERPYHRLLKDDKLVSDQLNNPVNDCEKSRELLIEEVEAWNALPEERKLIFSLLLKGVKEFYGFLRMVEAPEDDVDVEEVIRSHYFGKICGNSDLHSICVAHPIELAYALALVSTSDFRSLTPGWVLHNYPEVENILRTLRHTPCKDGCEYCSPNLDVKIGLKRYFGYDGFRLFNGEPLQELAAKAAIERQSVLAIFPTGGGKSLAFQLPALMAGRAMHGLTVVISPLQSLMKDQIDNLADKGITEAVTINGLLDPISRSEAIERVRNGDASLLYISPEMLRSATIEHILLHRTVVRFVIDEAHCFSSWGQDFRVDYLYIGNFIARYEKLKRNSGHIPVSCFTATAKPKVISDICDYFKRTLGLDMRLFASSVSRANLHYSVLHAESDEHKYSMLRRLLSEDDRPTIIYASRTKRTLDLALKLTRDGFPALPFNGRMESDDKIANQDAFMSGKVRIIVATSAFGMGVDKSDVGMVIHYDISDSLENYVQEAGRAGRDPRLSARCYVLYSDNDLDKHFILLNQTKLSLSEIQQVWRAIKDLSKQRDKINCSALEIARQAGWDDSVSDIETRVRTALAALEQSGYIERGNNVPHVYATGITVKNVDEARKLIMQSALFDENEVENAVRVIKSLISAKYIAKAQETEAESRVDYIADILGLNKYDVISSVNRMRQEGILADSKDISAYILDPGDSARKSRSQIERFARLEEYILNRLPDDTLRISCKQLNDDAIRSGIESSKEKDIRTLLYFLTVKGYTHKLEDPAHNLELKRQGSLDSLLKKFERRIAISGYIIDWLYSLIKSPDIVTADKAIRFSVVQLLQDFRNNTLYGSSNDVQLYDIEEALLYLSRIKAIKLDGGFLVLYNAMSIHRLKDSRLRYRQDDYKILNEFYRHKIQQVHIVGEYANLMVRDYQAALQYVSDYFSMDFKKFIAKYFKGDRVEEIQRNLTPQKYDQLFGGLSAKQREIISDRDSRCIVVAAGPGSGKTRLLVHKLASLLLLEDVKHEQLLMLTFSRAAATEFKQRLMELIGNAAHFVDIKTFHGYSFDLLGRLGTLEQSGDVVGKAAAMIEAGEVEPSRIGKSVLVIDEAQDMGPEEYALVKAMMSVNDNMRVIAVGDDDQNIYEFRGADSSYMYGLAKLDGGKLVEMTENFRSYRHPVAYANNFVKRIGNRLKQAPIISMKESDGSVIVCRHEDPNMYIPIVNHYLAQRLAGSSAFLTRTNEEATILAGYLRDKGVNAKLIQSTDGLRFWNVAELRYFVRYIEKRSTAPLISDDLWNEALERTIGKYEGSTGLSYLKRCLGIFSQVNRGKYLSDFKEFAFESNTEDFCEVSAADVVVSTIHKAKGREFDNVYMLVSDNSIYGRKPSDLRSYYVGITRARSYVAIHTNGPLFGPEGADGFIQDGRRYELPENVTLEMSHRDVHLGYFKDKKDEVLSLMGGDLLSFKDNTLYNLKTGRPVARLSMRMQETIKDWESRGYTVTDATVRFVVAWKPADAPPSEPETAVALADLHLKRFADTSSSGA